MSDLKSNDVEMSDGSIKIVSNSLTKLESNCSNSGLLANSLTSTPENDFIDDSTKADKDLAQTLHDSSIDSSNVALQETSCDSNISNAQILSNSNSVTCTTESFNSTSTNVVSDIESKVIETNVLTTSENKIVDGNLILDWFEKTVDSLESGQNLSSIYDKVDNGSNIVLKDSTLNISCTQDSSSVSVVNDTILVHTQTSCDISANSINDSTKLNDKPVVISHEFTSVTQTIPVFAQENSNLVNEKNVGDRKCIMPDNLSPNPAKISEQTSKIDWKESFVPSMLGAVVSTELESKEKHLNKDVTSENSSSEDESSSDSDESSTDTSSSDSIDSPSSKLVIDVKKREEVCRKPKPLNQPATPTSVLLESKPIVNDVSPSLPDNFELEHIGNINSLIENSVVVVKALPYKVALNLESILFLEDKTVLGEIYETFGPVTSPYYVVCFKNGKNPSNLVLNQQIFFAPQVETVTKYVFANELKKLRGSDASWEHDREPPQNMLDYSDDEQERMAKKKRSLKRTRATGEENTTNANTDAFPHHRPTNRRSSRGRGSWTNSSVRYANPATENMNEVQSGWVNAFANLPSRRGNNNCQMPRHQQPMMMPPSVNPLRNVSPFQNHYPGAMRPAQPSSFPVPGSWNQPQFSPTFGQPPPPPPPPPPPFTNENLPDMSTLFNAPPPPL